MIQRIQTVYLFIVFLLSAVLGWFLPWLKFDQTSHNLSGMISSQNLYQIIASASYITIGVMAFVSLLLYKNRTSQLLINRINIILNFLLFGLLIVCFSNVPGEIFDSMKGIGVWIPWISIVFLLLANSAIKKDDNLVKSVDRLR